MDRIRPEATSIRNASEVMFSSCSPTASGSTGPGAGAGAEARLGTRPKNSAPMPSPVESLRARA